MRWLSALSGAMRTWRTGRIDLNEADRLVGGYPPGPAHPGLGVLLDAANAPAFAQELAGQAAAVAGFAAAGGGSGPITMPVGRRRARVLLSTRAVAVKVVAGVAVLVASTTAFAAEAGALPNGLQRRAHDMFSALGVPGPGPGDLPAGPGDGASGLPPTAPATAGNGPTPDPGDAAILGACRAWDALHKHPAGKPLPPGISRVLIAAAGDAASIASFCAKLLAEDNTTPGSPPTPLPEPTPSHPGQGKGNGHQPHPTPTPHR